MTGFPVARRGVLDGRDQIEIIFSRDRRQKDVQRPSRGSTQRAVRTTAAGSIGTSARSTVCPAPAELTVLPHAISTVTHGDRRRTSPQGLEAASNRERIVLDLAAPWDRPTAGDRAAAASPSANRRESDTGAPAPERPLSRSPNAHHR